MMEQCVDVQELSGFISDLAQKGLTLAIAESCTGGLLTHLVTQVSGASKILKGGLVVYSNDWKETLLHVSPKMIQTYGVVSSEVVIAMVKGLHQLYASDYCLSVSGIAGPEGGTLQKPVGTVWIGIKLPYKKESEAYRFLFKGDRKAIQEVAALTSLDKLIRLWRKSVKK